MVICYKGKNRTFGKVSNETVSLPNALEKPYFSYLSPLRTVNLILHIPWGKNDYHSGGDLTERKDDGLSIIPSGA